MSDPYYTGYARPKSSVGPVFRGFVIGLGIICFLASLGWGGYRIAIIAMYLAADGTPTGTWVWTLGTLIEGILLALVLAPIALTAVIFAGKRTPTKRWRWITTLVVGILCACVIIGMRAGSKVEVEKFCEGVSTYYVDYCNSIWGPGMGISAGVAVGVLLWTIFFTVFFKKNVAVGGVAGHVPVGMQPLINQPYPFANQGYSNAEAAAYAPPPQQTAYDPYVSSGQYPYPTPYGNTYGGNRELDDKDSVHSGAQSLGYAQGGQGYAR